MIKFGVAPSSAVIYEYDFAEDWRHWECIALDIQIPDGRPIELEIKVYPLVIGRPEYIESATAVVSVAGEGWRTVEVSFEQFDYLQMTGAFWRFIHKAELSVRSLGEDKGTCRTGEEVLIDRIRLKKQGRIGLGAGLQSKSASPGETVRYELFVSNETQELQAVTLSHQQYGFESMRAELEPRHLLLGSGETGRAWLTVEMHEGIAPGGFETHQVLAVPGGDSSFAKKLKLITVRSLPHPYIIHTESGWEGVRRNIQTYEWAQNGLEKYIKKAEEWIVPQSHGAGAPHAFELHERFNLHAAAVAWKLTGRNEFLGKAVLLLRRFADPQTGYPGTSAPIFGILSSREEAQRSCPTAVKVCGGGLIHEGEFMLDVASCYDLLYNEDCWTESDRNMIEMAFRLFIDKIDWAITDGDTNNIPSGAMIGALLCSLAIGDMHWIRRFISGPGGFMDMIATGIMDDGWYFEGASNYVVLFADMFTRAVHACAPWGINLKDMQVPPSYNRNAMLSPWSFPREKPFLGMSFEKYGPVNRNYRSVRDVWDAMLPFIDYRGILFAANDSTEKDMVGWYDLAYHVWREPKYAEVLRHADRRDLIYGIGELPEQTGIPSYSKSADAPNVGLTVLRSQTAGRTDAQQIQAVIKYGSHGGYHGHFDRTGLLSLMRHGRHTYSPLASWYSYFPFMFKMWVQTSMAHNMVVVDGRMQEPAPSGKLLFHSGSMMQACAVETTARWSDPPYGGQTPYPERFPEERCLIEGRDMPNPEEPRQQGDIGTYSEPVLQRRLLIVTDDYAIVADYLRGGEMHEFDCLYHFQGYEGIRARELKYVGHTGQFNPDPYNAGQFITDCDWYECESPALIRFSHEYDRDRDDRDGRHLLYNENGRMNVEMHALWPPKQEIVTGWYAEADAVNKRVSYQVSGDGLTLAEGRFGAWILGIRHINVPLEGVQELMLIAEVERAVKKTLFWGDAFITTENGRRIHLSELPVRYENVDPGHGIGIDYYGGPVHLEGEPYEQAVPFEPEDRSLPAKAWIDLSGIGAVKFEAVIGGDYPLGIDPARRKTISFRTRGKEARFLSMLEPHEGDSRIDSAEALSAGEIIILLKDGRKQQVTFTGLDGDGSQIAIGLKEYKGVELIREETAGGQ
ncbi:heparinase II/III-family protein [Paenibacillus sp. sptzw28]|uniref:heparinase II/III family protein n=1 Tax=Paenibacillus sp. sptzw28 TaxID=715179 RepID=UPI001C6E28C5|nr:heparinase II/III family protein [Paenibacillus sp. sptzw28]QYR19473.1 heparinase II/III-family protein [Paenibacillus sp. sptzw28]